MKKLIQAILIMWSAAAFAQPANDNCASAINLAIGTGTQAWNCAGTNVGATVEAGEPGKCGAWLTAPSHTVWYKVTLPAGVTSLNVTLDNPSGTLDDTQVEIFSGACGSLTSKACDDDAGYEGGLTAEATATGLTAGSTYYIRVDGYSTLTGTFCIKAIAPPANDCYTSATSLTAGTTVNGTTYGAGGSASENCGASDCVLGGANSVIDCGAGAGASIENSVYYTVPCNVSGTYTLDLTSVVCNGTNGVQVWGALDAACTTYDGQKQDASSGDLCINTGAYAATMSTTFSCTAGQTVRFLVDGFAGELCTFAVTVTAPAVLPVELLSFVGYFIDATNAVLKWATETESDNEKFILERSLNGIDFEAVTEVAGAGNSSTRQDYSVTDYNVPSDRVYYRLAQVDFDGDIKYSHVIALIGIPNPDFRIVKIDQQGELIFKSNTSEKVIVEAYNIMGQLAYREEIWAEEGENKVSLSEFNNVPEGIYIFKITKGQKVITQKYFKN